ncbi:MAG TPA: hypothetical protein VHE55_07730 [Fimbriimonadaceae bacterium]|nr:hypothetical protein [Fimbriimonadaceae bacterium]
MSESIAERTKLPNVFEWQADCLMDAAKNVAYWVGTTPEDRLSWRPKAEGEDSKTRCVYDQIHECAQINRRFTNLLNGVENGPWVPNHSYTSSEEAQADLKTSTEQVAAVIRTLDDEALTREYQGMRGTLSGKTIISLLLANMYYHGGQINQIQLLLGDDEFRYPED